jgi:putative ATP-binding cassette transporter
VTLWTLLRQQLRHGGLRFMLVSTVVGILMARFAIGLARTVTDPAHGDVFASGVGAVIVVTAVQLGRAWTGLQISRWFGGLARVIRRRLLAAYLRLEPAALIDVPAGDLREALAALPRRLNTLLETAGLAVSSVFWAVANLVAIMLLVPAAGLALSCVIAIYGLMLMAQVPRMRASETVARRQDAAVARGINELLAGVKELRLDPAKLATLRHEAIEGAMQARVEARRPYRSRLAMTAMLSRSIQLLAAIPVVAVMLLAGSAPAQMAVVLIVLFLFPYTWLQSVPQLASAAATSDQLQRIEARLAAAAARVPPPALPNRSLDSSFAFMRLELGDVIYRYPTRPGAPGFVLGPVSCSFAPGRITFLAGGNGSGKSTLMRMACGLVAPDDGTVLLNGEPIDGRLMRDLVATVPASPVLFERLHGVEADPEEVNAMLADFGLAHTVRFEGGRFSRLGLSTGQRKRVALIGALLQRRPVLVLDEFAADQDPPMRQRFYREILPALRDKGLAIIAVTHDDRYFDAADEVLTMENGRLIG